MQNIFTETMFLSAAEVNAEGELSLPLLTQKIIDVATAHANSLGIGNPSMELMGCGWVLSRLAVEMDRWPGVNETYSISTWVESWNRHFSVRNFRVADAKGNPLGHASSVWMVLNYRTHENAGLSHLSLAADMISGEGVPIAKPGRPHIGDDAQTQREYRFKYCDLDFYRHVNTVRYIELLLNSFGLEMMDEWQIARIDLAFMRESRYGRTVKVKMQERIKEGDERHIDFSLVDSEDGETAVGASVLLRVRKCS